MPDPAERTANVAFANDLLDAEIAQRTARKEAQENAARNVIVASGLVLTLLLGLSKDAGLFSAENSVASRLALTLTVALGAGAASCAVGAIWPRTYDRLGGTGLDRFNDSDFLDEPTHYVTGVVVATRIGIAKTMDDQHERKARWFKWSLRFLVGAFVALLAQGIVLAVSPPSPDKSSDPVHVIIDPRHVP